MPIHIPGKRDRHNKVAKGKRTAVASLSLTAMVDMFTVLTIFLLQNYKETGEVIQLRNDMELPKATQIRELKPANVVIVTKDMIMVNENPAIPLPQVTKQQQWLIFPLYQLMQQTMEADRLEHEQDIKNKLKSTVASLQEKEVKEKDFRKVTLQADKDTDFLTVKKVMYTLTEAGASEIHFAVLTESNKYKELDEQNAEGESL
ncbi:MAG: biopolymer transporter ExbD [Bdellovibrionota bacterium]|nr:adventurous gliding motility protein S [Pseudobdellovibrionaceae bacterium]|tara:strand:- start:9891 stop:10499 length:609 start_codon:yes stop_codon:yes gene_type:complete